MVDCGSGKYCGTVAPVLLRFIPLCLVVSHLFTCEEAALEVKKEVFVSVSVCSKTELKLWIEECTGDNQYKWEECNGDRHYIWEECTGDGHYI